MTEHGIEAWMMKAGQLESERNLLLHFIEMGEKVRDFYDPDDFLEYRQIWLRVDVLRKRLKGEN